MEKGIGSLRARSSVSMPSAFGDRRLEEIRERARDRQLDQQIRDYRLLNQRYTDNELRNLSRRDLELLRSRGSVRDKERINEIIAEQAARQGISPPEQRMMLIQKTASDMGKTISDDDAKAFGMGVISFAEAMSRAIPMVDMDQVAMERNLMQQEQMFFPTKNSLGRQLAKFQKSGIPEMTMTLQERLNKITDPIMQTIENEKEAYSDQMSRGFAAGDEVDVDALPKGLKAMYDSGPKGREGVENIAAKTDKFAEGGAVEGEIEQGLEELQGVQPEVEVIQQVMTMVMEMIQAGASEEQIVAALRQMGLDDEDIQQVMMMVAEEMAGQESIDGQLAQMM